MRTITSLLVCFFITLFCVDYAYGQVPYSDRHSQIQSDAWISNVKSISPNAVRGSLHWIRYDFGDTYAIQKSKFWNINTPSILTAGAKSMIIDYSIDGITWLEWGRYDLPQGSGSTMYQGEDGPNFSGLIARYILINITSNYGNTTNSGLAEVKFEVAPATTSVSDSEVKTYEINIFPNPATSTTTIEVDGIKNFDNLYYQISDAAGKTVETKKLNSNSWQYDVKDLATGVYNFSIIHPSGIKSTKLNVVK